MDVKALAVKNYPQYWSKERVAYLVSIGRLIPADYKDVTGEDYETE